MPKPAAISIAPAWDEKYAWEVLVIVMIGTLMSALDTSIVNVSLPAIMADFGVGVDDIEWVVTGYMLSFATLMPLTSWLKERIGTKQLYIWSLVIFTLGSVLCGVAWNLPTLISARVIQALGGGALTPVGMAMISEVFPPEQRGKAIGYWGVGVIMGPAFGPTLGGFLTKTLGWRSIFMVNLPVGVAGVLMAITLLRHEAPQHASKPFDFWGFGFLSLFLVCFLLGLSKGEQKGWESPYIVICFVLAALGFVGFMLVELNTIGGIIDLGLFRYKVFSASMIVTAVRSVALFGGMFLLPLFLQNVQGLDEIRSGLILLPGSLAIAVLMPVAGKLGDRIAPFIPTFFGLLGMAIFMYMYRNLDVNTTTWDIILPTLIRGFGLGLLVAPSMAAALNAVPKSKIGMASAMVNLVSQVAGSIGIAVLATVLSHRAHYHMAAAGQALQMHSPAFQATLQGLMQRAQLLGLNLGAARLAAGVAVAKHVAQVAMVAAFDDVFLVGTGIMVLGMAASLLLPKRAVHNVEVDADVMLME